MQMPSPTGDDKDLIKLLETQIKILSLNCSLKLEELPSQPDIQNTFESLKLAVAMMYDTVAYPELINAIRRNHPEDNISPGTIGAYLFGCINGHTESIPEGCSPMCVDAIPTSQTGRCCPNQVWSIEKGHLKRHGSDLTKSQEAYLYVPEDFTSLTRKQYRTLKDKGVAGVFLVRTGKSQYRLDGERKMLDEIIESDSPTQENMGAGQSNQAGLRQFDDTYTTGSVAYVQPTGQPTTGYATTGYPTTGYAAAYPTHVDPIVRTGQTNNTWIWILVIIVILVLIWWFFFRNPREADVGVVATPGYTF